MNNYECILKRRINYFFCKIKNKNSNYLLIYLLNNIFRSNNSNIFILILKIKVRYKIFYYYFIIIESNTYRYKL